MNWTIARRRQRTVDMIQVFIRNDSMAYEIMVMMTVKIKEIFQFIQKSMRESRRYSQPHSHSKKEDADCGWWRRKRRFFVWYQYQIQSCDRMLAEIKQFPKQSRKREKEIRETSLIEPNIEVTVMGSTRGTRHSANAVAHLHHWFFFFFFIFLIAMLQMV